MNELITVAYFIGLALFGAAVGSYNDSYPVGVMIIGGGLMLYAGVWAIIEYLHKD